MALLRIMSINLLVDRADPDDLRRVIGAADPDVLCAQELGETCAGVVADLLPHGHLNPRDDLFGLGIATRHPVSVERLELPGRCGWAAQVVPDSWPGLTNPLDVVNVHLVNPIDRPWRSSRGQRRGQIAGVASYLGRRGRASIVIGDMNASPAWREYKLLCDIGVDAARVTGTARRTWSHFVSGPRLLRIDHAFIANARPITTEAVPVRGSDHSALIVDIEV
ncbi:MAG: endonuclease/exonuclease/phosphatase family protein [Actinomycetia bacterium]|nr:endonuclease/exonuclease/phosphatase family protein [Actinomycetes bacterium]